MSTHLELVPKTENPPAKVKDAGVIEMVKAGAAAYNAKTSELLLLPVGEKKRAAIASSLTEALFANGGFQQVACGNDQAILSLAERYIREWKGAATAYADGRDRGIRLLAWHADKNEASSRVANVRDALEAALPDIRNLRLVENCEADGLEHAYVLSPGNQGTLNGVAGFACGECGGMFLPDSPYIFGATQPGAGESELPLEDIATPGANTIKDLCELLGLNIQYTLKAMLYVATDGDGQNRPVASFVRGDFNVSMAKLARWLEAERGLTNLRTAEKPELYEMIGEVAGYCGPVGLPENVTVVCDTSVRGSKNTVVGANKPGYHRKGCCHGRDFDAPIADIAQLTEGVPCSCGKGTLSGEVLRVCGSIALQRASGDAAQGPAMLAYRDRDGSHEYPYVLSGDISTESLVLAAYSP